MSLYFFYGEDIFNMEVVSNFQKLKGFGSEQLSYTCCLFNRLSYKTVFMLKRHILQWDSLVYFNYEYVCCGILKWFKISYFKDYVLKSPSIVTCLFQHSPHSFFCSVCSMLNYFWLKTNQIWYKVQIYWLIVLVWVFPLPNLGTRI